MRAVVLALLAAGCATTPPPVAETQPTCPPVPAAPTPPIARLPAVGTVRAELNRAEAAALAVASRVEVPVSVLIEVRVRSRAAETAVDRLERRQRYDAATTADLRTARIAVANLADYAHANGAP